MMIILTLLILKINTYKLKWNDEEMDQLLINSRKHNGVIFVITSHVQTNNNNVFSTKTIRNSTRTRKNE